MIVVFGSSSVRERERERAAALFDFLWRNATSGFAGRVLYTDFSEIPAFGAFRALQCPSQETPAIVGSASRRTTERFIDFRDIRSWKLTIIAIVLFRRAALSTKASQRTEERCSEESTEPYI